MWPVQYVGMRDGRAARMTAALIGAVICAARDSLCTVLYCLGGSATACMQSVGDPTRPITRLPPGSSKFIAGSYTSDVVCVDKTSEQTVDFGWLASWLEASVDSAGLCASYQTDHLHVYADVCVLQSRARLPIHPPPMCATLLCHGSPPAHVHVRQACVMSLE